MSQTPTPRMVEITGVAADPDGLVASVTPAGGGVQSLTLLAAASDLDPPRRVEVTSTLDETARTVTVTGVDRYGKTRTESFSLANAGPALSTWEYQSVSSMTIDDDTAGAIEAGWDNVFYSQWVQLELGAVPFNVSIGVIGDTGSFNYDVEHSLQHDWRENGWMGHNDTLNPVFTHDSLDGATANGDGNYAFPIVAVRLKLNSVDAATVMRMFVIQSGQAGT